MVGSGTESGTGGPDGSGVPGGPDGTGGTGGSTEQVRLRRTLGFRDLVVYGLLFIAPMAPVGVFGTLDAKSDGAVALVYIAATVVMAFTAFSYAQMVRVAPLAGSVFAYARKGLGEGPGFIAGWMAMLDYLLIPAVAYLFSGIAMNSLVPEVSRWVWTALAVVLTTLLNLWGVRAAARVGFAVLAMEIVVLLVFMVSAVVVLARDGAQRDWLSPLTGDSGFSTSAVLGAVSVAVLSYLGFDAIASFAEEVTGGSAKVARAVLFCLVLAGVLFVAQAYLAALLEPMTSAELAADPVAQGSAFYDTVDSAVGTWLHDLVAVSKAIGAAFAALAGQAAAGRLLFAMAREHAAARAAVQGRSGFGGAEDRDPDRGGRHDGGGGVGGQAGRRAGSSGVRGGRRGADRVRPAPRVGGRLVRGAADGGAAELVAPCPDPGGGGRGADRGDRGGDDERSGGGRVLAGGGVGGARGAAGAPGGGLREGGGGTVLGPEGDANWRGRRRTGPRGLKAARTALGA